MIDQRDFAMASVSFHLGAMMIGAHSTDMATFENWKGGISTSGETSGNSMLGNAAIGVHRRGTVLLPVCVGCTKGLFRRQSLLGLPACKPHASCLVALASLAVKQLACRTKPAVLADMSKGAGTPAQLNVYPKERTKAYETPENARHAS